MAEIPETGFIRLTAPAKTKVTPVQKAALIRRGNQLFGEGKITLAQKMFLTLGYSDGIIRCGDYHYKKADYWEAFRMYKLAPAPQQLAELTARMADVVREWLNDD